MTLPSAYNPNIPQASDLLSVSQGNLLNNFGAIQALIDVDHVDFANTYAGQHNKVSLVNQASLPVFNPLGEIGLYSATDATTSQSELYINKTNASGIVQVAATESVLGTVSAPTSTTPGWTMLPSGIKLAWGIGTGSSSGIATVTLTGGQVFSTAMLSVQCTTSGTLGSLTVYDVKLVSSSLTTNTFQVYVVQIVGGVASYSSQPFTYLAIGY